MFAMIFLVMILLAGCEYTPNEQAVTRTMLNHVADTQADFLAIYIAAALYRDSEGTYPKSLSDLATKPELLGILDRVEKTAEGYAVLDRWYSKPVKYVCPGRVWRDAFDVYSFGPDGIDDEGKHDDVTSWDLIERNEDSHRTWSYRLNYSGVAEVTKRLIRISNHEEH